MVTLLMLLELGQQPANIWTPLRYFSSVLVILKREVFHILPMATNLKILLKNSISPQIHLVPPVIVEVMIAETEVENKDLIRLPEGTAR